MEKPSERWLELSPEQKQKKNRLERWAIALVAISLAILTLVQREVIDLGPELADNRGIVALVSINVSVLLTTLLILLILRNLYRVFFESKGYSSLQLKMVVSFICLSLVPTLLIFYYSHRQTVQGHELWFSAQIEQALGDSIELTDAVLLMDNQLLARYGTDILSDLEKLPPETSFTDLEKFLAKSRQRFSLSSLEIYNPQGELMVRSANDGLAPIYHEWFAKQGGAETPWFSVVEVANGELSRWVWPLVKKSELSEVEGYFALGQLTTLPIRSQMEDVRHALVAYRDALVVERPFRVTQLTALTTMAMLAIFISVWIGSHLARSLARPVLDLVNGTKQVASGDWDFQLDSPDKSGEFAELVRSFNQMTRDLREMYAELDSRRRFLETVLKNVSTGVVVLNPAGNPISANEAAKSILEKAGINQESDDLATLPSPLKSLINETMDNPHSRRLRDHHLRLNQGESLSLRASVIPLANDDDILGYLLAFDDLTDLENAQRVAAWREVARRIAHEVKNPLTPIQLATQRLQRRLGGHLANEEDSAIFLECTDVIVRQVEEMKKLVDEFSQFARLPETKPILGDFATFLEESLPLFQQAHKKVSFELEIKDRPLTSFDPEQMRRVLTNILENAVAAMNQEGKVFVVLETNDLVGLRLTISDTGPGVAPEIQARLFEPYVTTKKNGQGLGLAMVKTIVNDHGGFIKAQTRPEGGARFTIELPLRRS